MDLSKYTTEQLHKFKTGDYSEMATPDLVALKSEREANKSQDYWQETAKNLPSDLMQNIKTLTPGLNLWEGIKAGREMAKTVKENKSIFDPYRGWKMLGGQLKESIAPTYTHPIESFKKAPISTVMGWTPAIKPAQMLAKGVAKGAGRIAGGALIEAGTKEVPVNTAKELGKLTGLEHSVVEDIAMNKGGVHDVIGNATESMVDDLGDVAARKYTHVMYDGIDKAESDIYKNAGIKDSDLLDISDVVPSVHNKMATFHSIAELAPTAKKVAGRAWEQLQKSAKNGWKMTYGDLKDLKRELFKEADNMRTEQGAATKPTDLLNGIGHDLIKAQDKVPALRDAADKFETLYNTRKDMAYLARMPVAEEIGQVVTKGEGMLEKRVFGRTLDKGNVGWKKDLEKVGENLKSVPESAHLADVVDDFKKTWAADSIVRAEKAGNAMTKSPPFPLNLISTAAKKIGLTSPTTAAQIIKSGTKSGTIPIKKLAERALVYKNPIIGRQMSTIRTLLDSGYGTEMARNLPLGVGMGVKGLQALSRHPETSLISAMTNIKRGGKNGNTKY
jgi:hypothetical protein